MRGSDSGAGARLTPRVALATCAEVPELDEDGTALVASLARRGIQPVPAIWDSPSVDWSGFDLVVVRSTWDYAERRDFFLAWAEALPRVLNPLDVLRWNTDKRYLCELAAAGVAVVPTQFLEVGGHFSPPPGRFVVKPAVSAGGRSSASYEPHDAAQAREHVRALHAEGRAVMIQPYVTRIDERGETAVIYLGGRYSHAIKKASLLSTIGRPTQQLYLDETIEAREPTPDERQAADVALAAVPFDQSTFLYARVDLVAADDGSPLVLEVELTEPSLYLAYAADAVERLAGAIAVAVRASAHR